MLRRLLPTLAKAKNSLQNRAFSAESINSDLDSWIKIYREMRNEAGFIADAAINNVRSDVSALRAEVKSDVSALKSDFANLKTEVSILKVDVSAIKNDLQNLRIEMHKQTSDIHKQTADIHKQMSNNTRLLLAGMFGSVTAGLGINQYLESRKNKSASEPHVNPAASSTPSSPAVKNT